MLHTSAWWHTQPGLPSAPFFFTSFLLSLGARLRHHLFLPGSFTCLVSSGRTTQAEPSSRNASSTTCASAHCGERPDLFIHSFFILPFLFSSLYSMSKVVIVCISSSKRNPFILPPPAASSLVATANRSLCPSFWHPKVEGKSGGRSQFFKNPIR